MVSSRSRLPSREPVNAEEAGYMLRGFFERDALPHRLQAAVHRGVSGAEKLTTGTLVGESSDFAACSSIAGTG